MRNDNVRNWKINYGSRMSEPRAGHFRTPMKENGRRIGKNADTSIRHGARKGRREGQWQHNTADENDKS